MRNNEVHVPLFYQDILTTWQALKFDRKILNPKDALCEFLFANPIFTNNGQTLYYFNFINYGITKVKHIWRTNRFASLEEVMISHNIPVRNRDRMREEYQIITQAIPNQIVQLIQGTNSDHIQESNHLVVQEIYHVNKEAVKSKDVYERLLYMKSNGFEHGFRVFTNADLMQDEPGLKDLEAWWSRLYRSDLDNKAKEFQWQISHKALYTLMRLNEIDPEMSRSCVMCTDVSETIEHVFSQCVIIQAFWLWLFREFRFTTDLDKRFIYVNSFKTVTDCQFSVLCLGKKVIWETRNILRQTNLPNIVGCLKINFKFKTQSHLTTLYHTYKAKGNLTCFETKYLMDAKISVVDEKVMLNLNI